MRRFTDDVRDEGMQPDHTIEIRGLDEHKIKLWWSRVALVYGNQERQGPLTYPWSTLGWNCARIVATALKEGGGDQYAKWFKSWNLVWTPNDVRNYARSIAQNIRS